MHKVEREQGVTAGGWGADVRWNVTQANAINVSEIMDVQVHRSAIPTIVLVEIIKPRKDHKIC